jgi:Cu/Ag efflux pump CusA
MIAPIVNWAVHKRWLVLLLTVLAAVIGAAALYRLPIDAVPDITNNQVQINVKAPALSPELVEKQVAFPIETALPAFRDWTTPVRSAAMALPRSQPFSTTRPTSISRASR